MFDEQKTIEFFNRIINAPEIADEEIEANVAKFHEYLSLTHMCDEETLAKLDEGVAKYHGDISIRMDKTCMDATDRYKVFREDGMVYNNWDELPKVRKLIR